MVMYSADDVSFDQKLPAAQQLDLAEKPQEEQVAGIVGDK